MKFHCAASLRRSSTLLQARSSGKQVFADRTVAPTIATTTPQRRPKRRDFVLSHGVVDSAPVWQEQKYYEIRRICLCSWYKASLGLVHPLSQLRNQYILVRVSSFLNLGQTNKKMARRARVSKSVLFVGKAKRFLKDIIINKHTAQNSVY